MKAQPSSGQERTAPSRETLPETQRRSGGEGLDDIVAEIPQHLRAFVVEQRSDRYTATDQSVWRFVLMQLASTLANTAHPAYARGLAESGISTECIPSIEQMNHCLSRIGWGAVCVDGFIPARAFQSFQAMKILPIAAEIRSPNQLPYTPAPDIIHEAAGHAPILVDPAYSSYVQRVGRVASRAFSSPGDARVDRAVRTLSDLEDQKSPEPEAIAAAREELAAAVGSLGEPSEATRIARLFWWTAEYGLVGSPRDYRAYGAGLLSSLGESHSCQRAEVEKRVLDAGCTRVGYDITRPQPQLYVARDFAHLHEVLSVVEASLAHQRGGSEALERALASDELCTLHLAGGLEVTGTLERVDGSAERGFALLRAGSCFSRSGCVVGRANDRTVLPFGPLHDGRDPRAAERSELRRALRGNGVEFASGLRVVGQPIDGDQPDDALIRLVGVEFRRGEERLLESREPTWLAIGGEFITAHAGSDLPECWPTPATFTQRRCAPAERRLSDRGIALEAAYRDSRAAHRIDGNLSSGSCAGLRRLESLYEAARVDYPHEWLLYWNLLERFGPDARNSVLARQLRGHLRQLEKHHGGRHPITTGLNQLERRSS